MIESSICPTFSKEEGACIYHQRVQTGGLIAVFQFNLTRTELERTGETYYIRVSAENAVGLGIASVVIQRFLIIPSLVSPLITKASPLRVASGDNYAHIWVDGALLRSSQIRIGLSGINTNTVLDMQATMQFQGQTSGARSLGVFDPIFTDNYISFSIQLPQLPAGNFPCPQMVCPGSIEFFSVLAPGSRVILFLEYFRYKPPELVSVLPGGGPQNGGTQAIIRVRDFIGSESRKGAGFPSFEDTLHKDNTVNIVVECNDGLTSSPVKASSRFLPGVASIVDVYKTYELSFQVPPSPCGAELIDFRITVIPGSCSRQNYSWHPEIVGSASFLYRGPGVVEITPPSGMINVGNDRVVITIVLENVGSDYNDVLVTLEDVACVSAGDVNEVILDETQLVQIQVIAPQLPRESAGILTLKISSSIFGTFEQPWQFVAPPNPAISLGSITIDDEYRQPLWSKQRSSSSSIRPSKKISSLGAVSRCE